MSPPALGSTCPAGCSGVLEPMGTWAPYRTCTTCGTGFWIPPEQETFWGPGDEPSAEQVAAWAGRDAQRLATVGPGPGRLLDVGCGFGHFVQWARAHGWDAWGVERDPWARRAGVEPERVAGEPSELDGSFDLITLWDVLEHTTEPIELASSLRCSLREGGRLFVCSPNFAALKLRWPLLRRSPQRFDEVVRPGEHAVQFTEHGLRLTLERAGYERVTYLRPPPAAKSSRLVDLAVRVWPPLRSGLFVDAWVPTTSEP